MKIFKTAVLRDEQHLISAFSEAHLIPLSHLLNASCRAAILHVWCSKSRQHKYSIAEGTLRSGAVCRAWSPGRQRKPISGHSEKTRAASKGPRQNEQLEAAESRAPWAHFATGERLACKHTQGRKAGGLARREAQEKANGAAGEGARTKRGRN